MKATLVACCALAGIGALGAKYTDGYHLLMRVQVTSARGIFDYATVDAVNRRAYFAHGEEVVVLNVDSNAVVGTIPAPQFDPSYGVGLFGRTTPYQGVHHVAIAADLGRGFTANGRAGTSTIFDLRTLRKIGEVKLTGSDPNTVVYDAATRRVFAFNVDTHNATVFDATSGKVLKTIDLGGEPAFATSDDKGHVFVNLKDKDAVAKIDARDLVVSNRWAARCKGPQNETMAIDKTDGRLFVGCRPDFRRLRFPPGPSPDRIMQVLDTKNGRVVATIPIGANPDEAAFDSRAHLVFSANGEGSVTVIEQKTPNEYRVLQTVSTEPGAARLAVDPMSHKIFVPNNDPDPSGHGPNFPDPGLWKVGAGLAWTPRRPVGRRSVETATHQYRTVAGEP